MIISAVAITDLKQYANVYHNLDDNLFATILVAAKAFISTYTSLPISSANIDTAVILNAITVKYIDATCTVSGNVITVGSVGKTIGFDKVWVRQQITGSTGFAVDVGASSTDHHTIKYNLDTCDSHEDLTVALMILSNEMYDNRMVTLDAQKVNINFVVKTLLDSHSMNLL